MTDFNFLIASYKADFDDSNTLQTPFVRNGYVYYICTSDVIERRADKLEMIATYITPHSKGCVSICALQKMAHKLIERVKIMKKNLSRNWDQLTIFLNEEFAISIVDKESQPQRDRYHKNVATACSTPLT